MKGAFALASHTYHHTAHALALGARPSFTKERPSVPRAFSMARPPRRHTIGPGGPERRGSMSEQDRTVKVPTVVEKLSGRKVMVDFPTIGVSKGDVLFFGNRPAEAARVLLVKHGGREHLAQVYHSRRRKALRLRPLGALDGPLDLKEAEVLGTAVALQTRAPSAALTEEIMLKLRAWRCKCVSFDRAL